MRPGQTAPVFRVGNLDAEKVAFSVASMRPGQTAPVFQQSESFSLRVRYDASMRPGQTAPVFPRWAHCSTMSSS